MSQVALIAGEWRLRALAQAQLVDEGYDVRVWPSLDLALANLLRQGALVDVVVVDVESVPVDDRMLTDLWRVTGEPSLLLCEGLLSRHELKGEGLPSHQVLRRPFSVGDLVAAVKRLAG